MTATFAIEPAPTVNNRSATGTTFTLELDELDRVGQRPIPQRCPRVPHCLFSAASRTITLQERHPEKAMTSPYPSEYGLEVRLEAIRYVPSEMRKKCACRVD